MASFLIDSSAVAVTGTDTDDTLQIISGGNAITFEALGGDDEVVQSGSNGELTDSFFYLREGDDELTLETAGTTNTFVGGGPDNDTIFVSDTAGAFIGNTINGGQGEDNIEVSDFSGTGSGFSINGGRDDDTILFSGGNDAQNGFLGLGKGDDELSAATDETFASLSIAGGLGEDTMYVSADYMSGIVVNGGGNGTDGDADGDDDIALFADSANEITIVGNGGDDHISAGFVTAGNISINGNAGDDDISFSADVSDDITIGGGKGDDTITFWTAADASGATVNGGIGDDVLDVSDSDSAGTIEFEGGAGADTLQVTGANTTAQLNITNFADSTFGDNDVVVVSGGTESAGVFNIFTNGGVGVADGTAGSAGGANITVSGGRVEGLSAGGIDSLTAAVNFLSDNLDTNEAVVFAIGSSGADHGVFVKGADSDLFVSYDLSAGVTAGLAAASTTQGTVLTFTQD